MNRPAFRSLDGVELALPIDGNRWVLVPRALAHDEPDLIWALEYDDAPLAPQLRDELGGDPWLDYSDGALLVPIERWNARAAVEPALVGGYAEHRPIGQGLRPPPAFAGAARPRPRPRNAAHAARVSVGAITRVVSTTASASRHVVDGIALMLAMSFAVAVGEWVVPLRDGMSGLELGNGAILLPSALALASLSRWVCFGVLGRAACAIFRAGATIVVLAFAALLVRHGL
jgi:hypothetical protein